MGFEPTTLSLARRCSTTEPLPLAEDVVCARGRRCAEGQSRTGDTGIFSAVLYHLSYLGMEQMLIYANLAVKAGRFVDAGGKLAQTSRSH